MAYQKIAKDFVLSDSSVNVYGYKLLTSGYQLEEFKKNPIGYYGHDKKDGVLVKWDNLRIEGDKVIASPTINMEHPRGARTVSEINDGFLNAASVGRNVFVEADLEDNAADPENPTLVGTKWYNREASLVDAGANREALAIDLEDIDGKAVDLAAIKERLKPSNNMKTIQLKLTPALVKILNLGDKETDEAVSEAIEGLHADNETLTGENTTLKTKVEKAEKELADEKERVAGDKVTAALDKALTAGKINAITKTKLEKQFAGKPQDLEDLLEAMTPYQSLADKLNNSSAVPKDLEDMDWDAADKADKLQLIKDKFPAHFEVLKKAKEESRKNK